MKHLTRILVAILLATIIISPMLVSAKVQDIQVMVNGSLISFPDAKPSMDKTGRILVPLRSLSEIFGANVEWVSGQRLVSITKEGLTAASRNPSEKQQIIHYENKVIVLMYHHIDEKIQNSVIVTPAAFESHMKVLKDNGYNTISMEEYVQFIKNKGKVPVNAVLITFDDGYESVYKYAYPILLKYNYIASHFVIVSRADHPIQDSLPRLSWDQMREMKQNGMGFYSHSYDLHHYAKANVKGSREFQRPALANRIYLDDKKRQETSKEYKERIKKDLALAEQRLDEELGDQIDVLAFPFGAYNDAVVKIGKELKIEVFFTIKKGINTSGNILSNRINSDYESGEDFLQQLMETAGPKPIDRFAKKKNEVKVKVNGELIEFPDAKPYNQKGHVMIPLRSLVEIFGTEVEWVADQRLVIITK
jgi:biofilm PGA synthesis lipoprotein PgaB